jgi:5,10-methylenetetrahydromethanopterin reductase
VTNPYIINPAWTASAIATLNELSGGRAILGLGPGDRTTLGTLAIRIKMPLIAIKESVLIIRRLWQGELVDFTGKIFLLEEQS